MNSKSSDDAGIVDVESGLAVEETKEGESLESRTERIRRLNRERQRRRRMKLKMSRHDDTTMAPDASNVNMNLDNLEGFDNAGLEESERTGINVKTEQHTANVTPTKGRSSRTRASRRKQPSKHVSSAGEFATDSSSGSANNAITGSCHGQLTTSSSNEPSQDTSDQIAVLVVASEIEVFGENPKVLNGGGQDSEEALFEEQFEEEELARAKKDGGEARSPRRKRHSTTTSDDELNVTARREKQRELKRKQKERMTPDQVEALRARYREWRRRRKEVMTPEQLEIIRRGNRERQRRRRERLGVRKRLASSQTRGASDAVIQGLKNMQSQGKMGSETFTSGDSPKGSVSDLMNATGLTTIDDKTAANMPVAPSMGLSLTPVQNELPTMVTANQSHTAIGVTNAAATAQMAPVLTTTVNHTQSVPTTRMVPCGPGIGIPGMPQGAFFQGMPMPGMQGALYPGIQVPVSAGQAGVVTVSGAPTTMVTTIPISGVPGMSAQGAFLSGIPVTSTTANSPGYPQTATPVPNAVPFPREGQVLHNFQTLLPITPVQGMQGSSQGMAFFTQLQPLTGAGQVQGIPDPKYTIANQGNVQLAGLPFGTQIIQVPLTAEMPAEATKLPQQDQRAATEGQAKAKGRGRGRKRNTSAAEMLASLSTYVPPSSTPMASMLSAMASSARDRLNSSQAAAGMEEIHINSESPKTQTVVQSEGNAPILIQVPQNQPPGYAMYMSQQRGVDPYTVRTVVSTVAGQTTDVNANSFSLSGMSDSPSSIPHMNTFLTSMGGANRAGTLLQGDGAVAKPSGVILVDSETEDFEKISVAVATDTIQRATKGTNTGEGDDQSISTGTMTDTLVKSSVATNTDKQNQATDEESQESMEYEESTESAAAVIEGTD